MELGGQIRRLRLERHLTQEALADVLGVSRQAVTKWERGISLPSTANLLALCEVLDVSMEELIGCGARPKQPEERIGAGRLLLLSMAVALSIFGLAALLGEWSAVLPAQTIGYADQETAIVVHGVVLYPYCLLIIALLMASAALWPHLRIKFRGKED